MLKTVLLSIFALSLSSHAQSDKTDAALVTEWTNSTFHASLKKGFHFNLEAPNQMTIDGKGMKPTISTPHDLEFKIARKSFKSGRASLYVCDDALTFCQPKTLEFGSSGEANATQAPEERKVTRNEFGFIEDNFQAAADLATREKKLILLDVSARWCPGCIRLENEVFATSQFTTAAKPFVTVRLDYDRFENLAIIKQYNIHVIPTLLVLTSSKEEISRIVDFQPLAVVSQFLKDAASNPLPFADLQKKADAGDKAAALTLGRRLYAGFQFAKSADYLARVEPTPIELLDARVQAAKESGDKTAFQKIVRAAIAAEPASSRSIVWRTSLVESLDAKNPERQKIAEEGLAVGDTILAHPDKLREAMHGDAIGEFAGLETLYVASERADLAEAAGLDEATQQAARLKVTAIGRSMKIPIAKKGPALRYLIFLVAAHEFPEAESQVRAMIKRDPKNPELQRRLLRILNGLKKYPEAIKVGRETLAASFGKNEVWVAQQLAKAYVGDGKKAEARALATSYLARPDIDWTLMASEKKEFQDIANTP